MPEQKNLSSNDLTALSELISFEQWTCKKCKFYASNSTDPEVQQLMNGLAASHNQRFNTLLGYLTKF